MSVRKTSIWVGLLGVILLVSNTTYFSHGFHRLFTWVFVCIDVFFIVVAVVMFITAKRGMMPPPKK